ncbi:MAG: YgjV family protein [Clostridia bacterium]|nr:YgjV family protein [Clostridia bacterium]MBR2785886.1 YgjV family protein [Clostridia bacterium]
MINMILIQVIGAVAFLALSLSYFKKEKRQILFMQIIAYIFFTIHYFLLSGVAGCICNLIGLLALLTIYFFDKYKLKNKVAVSTFFIAVLIIVNILTFQNAYSIFPLIASTIVIISFIKDNGNVIRIIGIISAICWLIYAIVYKSYISIIFEAITFLNVCIALTKNISHKEKEKING